MNGETATVVPISNLDLLRHIYRSRLGTSVRVLFLIMIGGAIGFWFLGGLHELGFIAPRLKPEEHWSFLDCLYMTTISITTAGYGETLMADGLKNFPDVRIFTMFVLLAGMIGGAYFVSSATAFFVEGDLKHVLERRKMLKTIGELRGHYIVCGAGSTGRHIAEEIAATGKDVVVIDDDPKNVAVLHEGKSKVNSLIGDATSDETLREAGIMHARGLAAVLANDKDNLFLTISARQLNPNLRIISKAIDLPTQTKLQRAGADGVVSPQFIGGLRIASELVRPAVVSFLDEMLRAKETPVRFAEVTIGTEHAGRTLSQLDVTGRTGLPVLAIKRPGGHYVYNPAADVKLDPGTVIVTMGEIARVQKLEESLGDHGSRFLGRGLTGRVNVPPPGAAPAGEPPASSSLKDPRDPI